MAAAEQGIEDIRQWLADRLPSDWGVDGAEVVADAEEILIVLHLPPGAVQTGTVHSSPVHGSTGPMPSATAHGGETDAVARFREATRDDRMAVARAAEATFGRRTSWGARVGDVTVIFSTASVPVMTRLRLPERRVLDTLIDAGVARSRSEALAWCVRLVGDNESAWIAELRQAFTEVEAVRQQGPRSRRPPTPSS